MSRLARALKQDGVWYMSFKYGETERTSAGGRRFTDMTEPLLTAAIEQTGLSLVEMWGSTDVRSSHAGQRWLSALSRRLAKTQKQVDSPLGEGRPLRDTDG
jgi:hypothetical protein